MPGTRLGRAGTGMGVITPLRGPGLRLRQVPPPALEARLACHPARERRRLDVRPGGGRVGADRVGARVSPTTSFEDGKHEPGAADFYYGEMETGPSRSRRPQPRQTLTTRPVCPRCGAHPFGRPSLDTAPPCTKRRRVLALFDLDNTLIDRHGGLEVWARNFVRSRHLPRGAASSYVISSRSAPTQRTS